LSPAGQTEFTEFYRISLGAWDGGLGCPLRGSTGFTKFFRIYRIFAWEGAKTKSYLLLATRYFNQSRSSLRHGWLIIDRLLRDEGGQMKSLGNHFYALRPRCRPWSIGHQNGQNLGGDYAKENKSIQRISNATER
jgi:hypothetical protein